MVTTTPTERTSTAPSDLLDLRRARAAAGAVVDPELPMLTLVDLGVLRDVALDDEGIVTVTLTPTYSGCPALDVMRADVVHAVKDEGFDEVRVRTQLTPPWTTDDMTPAGRQTLAEHGIAPPGAASRSDGPVLVQLSRPPEPVACPRCGHAETALISHFGATACKALRRCPSCAEPFEHFKGH